MDKKTAQNRAKLNYARNHLERYTISLRKKEDAPLISDIEANKAAGISPGDTIRWLYANSPEKPARRYLRWAVIAQRRYNDDPGSFGDEFVTWCDSQQDAEDRARLDWHYLTDLERRRQTICAVLAELDEDECIIGWLRVAAQYGE